MKKITALLACLLLAIIAILLLQTRGTTPVLVINDVKLEVMVAQTLEARSRGLCCRDYLDANSGMIFIYDKPGNYRFWMKDTKIALDMYWINSDKKIIHIEENVQPSSYPMSFGTNAPAQYILETNAGFADKHNIQIGDQVKF